MKKQLLYEGKAKRVYKTDDAGKYFIEYKDDATAFNGLKKAQIAGKGVINNIMSSIIFEMLEQHGIPTHFVKRVSDSEQVVKAVKIYPLEVIVRNIAAGSLVKRLGFAEGEELRVPVLEFCYKNDELGDPMINEYHILAMKLASREEIDEISAYALKINEILKKYFLEKNIILVDFKLEFGNFAGRVILADEVSPDTCRFWDKDTKKKLDKDRFRQELGGVEEAYKEVLGRLTNEV